MEDIPETLIRDASDVFVDIYDIEPYNYYQNAQIIQNKTPHRWSNAISSIN